MSLKIHALLARRNEKGKDWEIRSGESIELKWNCSSWGRKTWRSPRYRIALERGRTRAHMLRLFQMILNSYINYSGNIAHKRIDGPVSSENCLVKVEHFFYGSIDKLVGPYLVEGGLA